MNSRRKCRRLFLEPLERRDLLAAFVVNNEGSSSTPPDDGIVTLADAINEANNNPGADSISFAAGVTLISNIGLTVRDTVTIDGGGTVTISGGFLNQAQLRLLDHSGSTITGLTFRRQPGEASVLATGSGGGHAIVGNRFERLSGGFGTRIGVEIRGTAGNLVGGSTAADQNLFVGLGIGVKVRDNSGTAADENEITGNLFGVEADGTGNSNSIGIEIGKATGTIISSNTVAGNGTGITLQDASSGTVVTDNRIGLKPNEDVALPNSTGIIVGGVGDVVDGNVVSGQSFGDGILITGRDNVIRNNLVGTSPDGSTAIPNDEGIVIQNLASGNTIGPGNVISGNNGDGITVEADASVPTGTTIIGNVIGLNAAKDAKLENKGHGIAIRHAVSTQIGGDQFGDENIISGNRDHGIFVTGGPFAGNANDAIQTSIEGNLIGINGQGASLGNGGDGIRIASNVDLTRIGSLSVIPGQATPAANVITNNAGHGVRIEENRQTDGTLEDPGDHAIVGNLIFGNGLQDIDTGPVGINPQDNPDIDDFLNHGIITGVRPGSTIVDGFAPLAEGVYLLQLFAEETGRFLAQQEFTLVSDNTFTITAEGDFEPKVRMTITRMQNGQAVETSEYSVQQIPAADLLIKGGYDADEHFGGDNIFQDLAAGVQIEETNLPVDPTAAETKYTFDVKIENEKAETANFVLRAEESFDNLGTSAGPIRYLSADGTDISSAIKSPDGHTISVSGTAGSNFTVIKLELNLRPNADPDDAVLVDISISEQGQTETIDVVRAVASNALIVNANSDDVADPAMLALGVPDVFPDAPGIQTGLRAAIHFANSLPGRQHIKFDLIPPGFIRIGATGNGPLPAITDAVMIDAQAPDGASASDPRAVILDGRGEISTGLAIASPASRNGETMSTIRGLAFVDFKGNAFSAVDADVTFDSNFIGVGGDGMSFTPVAGNGVNVVGGDEVVISNNFIGNLGAKGAISVGVLIDGAETARVLGNTLGRDDPNIDLDDPNFFDGVVIRRPKSFIVQANEIDAIAGDAIIIESNVLNSDTEMTRRIAGNLIGNTSLGPGDLQITSNKDGIIIRRTSNVEVTGNRVTEMDGAGIVIEGGSSAITLHGNLLGARFGDTDEFVNFVGILVRDEAKEIMIGGPTQNIGTGNGNTFCCNTQNIEILTSGDASVEIAGNLFGFVADDTASFLPGDGVTIQGEGTIVIGDSAVAEDVVLPVSEMETRRNVFNSLANGVRIEPRSGASVPPEVVIANNSFGLTVDRSATARKADRNILIEAAANVTIQNNSIYHGRAGIVAVNVPDGTLRIDRNEIGSGLAGQTAELNLGHDEHGIRLTNVTGEVRITGNKIGDNDQSGILLDGSANVTILDNQIGSTDTSVLANDIGIEIRNSHDITIGSRDRPNVVFNRDADAAVVLLDISPVTQGVEEETRNVALIGNEILSSLGTPLLLDGTRINNIRIEGNEITSFNGDDVELQPAIDVRGSRDSVIRKNRLRADNAIRIDAKNSVPAENIRISQNDIQSIDRPNALHFAIDLVAAGDGPNGRTPNDPLDPDTGNNSLQNSPVLLLAVEKETAFEETDGFRIERQIIVTGFLNSIPNTQFLLEFFPATADLRTINGDRVARDIDQHNSLFVTTNDEGRAVFSRLVGGFPLDDRTDHVTATATRIKPRPGGKFDFETSEFSEPLMIDEAADVDNDGFGDEAEGRTGARDSNDDGIPDALQPDVFAAEALGAVGSDAIDFDPLAFLDDGAIAAELPQYAFQSRTGDFTNGVIGQLTDPSGEFEFFRAVAFDIPAGDDNVATFEVVSATPINAITKSLNNDDVVTLTSDNADSPAAGVSVEFTADRRKVTVSVTDGSPADRNPLAGIVSDPVVPLLVDALTFSFADDAARAVTLARNGDDLRLTDENGGVLVERPLAETAIAFIVGTDEVDQWSIDMSAGGSFALRDPLIFAAGDGDDLLTLLAADLASVGQAIVMDGGDGTDTLRLGGAMQEIDLPQLAEGTLQDVETLDITGTGGNQLTLNADSVLQMSSTTDTVRVVHDADDVVFYGAGWQVDVPQIVDEQFLHILMQAGASIEVANTLPFQNPLSQLDVNFDGAVHAADVNVIVTAINTFGVHILTTPPVVDATFAYLDASGDNLVTALDALFVINHINQTPAPAESEGAAANFVSPGSLSPPAAITSLPLRTASDWQASSCAGQSDPGIVFRKSDQPGDPNPRDDIRPRARRADINPLLLEELDAGKLVDVDNKVRAERT